MTNQIVSSLKVITLAIVLSFGLSYVYAWTAPTVVPTGGNVLAPLNTSGTAQTKNGGLTVSSITAPSHCIGTSCITTWPTSGPTPPTGSTFLDTSGTAQTKAGSLVLDLTGKSGSAGRDALFLLSSADNTTSVILGNKQTITFWNTTANTPGDISARGFVGNGPIPLTPHYVNRSEDSYGAWPGWQYQYCNGWPGNRDTCPGNDLDYPYTCSASTQTSPTCVDSMSNNPADTGWCGRWFKERTVTCNINEVLSTYDI